MQTERLLKHAIQERIAVTLCINKIDRLILELKLPPNDAYSKIRYTLDQLNKIVKTFGAEDTPTFSPLNRNVIFASPRYNVCFSLDAFADLYCSKYSKYNIFVHFLKVFFYLGFFLDNLNAKAFADRLWGDYYLDNQTKRISPKGEIGQARTFVHFILDPLYKIFGHVAGDVDTCLPRFSKEMGIKLNKNEQKMNIRPLISLICKRFFGDFTGMLII